MQLGQRVRVPVGARLRAQVLFAVEGAVEAVRRLLRVRHEVLLQPVVLNPIECPNFGVFFRHPRRRRRVQLVVHVLKVGGAASRPLREV